jgi:hypothetical protein
VKPSGLGAFMEPRLFKASKIYSLDGIEHRKIFSSSIIIGVNKSSISASIGEFEEVNRLAKCEVKEPPILFLEDTQTPESSLRKLIALALLLIRVEV